jgi:hypothetical protein
MLHQGRSSSGTREHFLLIVLGLFLAAFGVAVFWMLGGIRWLVENRVGNSVQTVLDTTDKALQVWLEQTQADVMVLANRDDLRQSVAELIKTGRDLPRLKTSPALANIRRFLASPKDLYGLLDFSIIAPDGIQIGSSSDELLATKEIDAHNPGLLSKVLEGEVTLGLPYKSFRNVNGTRKAYPILTIAGPIRDDSGKVIAALALQFDARHDFTETMEFGRLDQTGETYAFDSSGELLSESRFTKELHNTGSLAMDEDSILNIQIRDPGGDILAGYRSKVPRTQQPLTKMAASAVTGKSGVDLEGYRDYRGVNVVGAWLWDDKLGFGLASEIDRAEAFAPYRRTRILVVALLSLMVAISILSFLILRHRDHLLASNRAYQQEMNARDDMMAIVAHDLRNPLNTMLLRSHLMIQLTTQCGGQQGDDLRRHL